jgi:hypothetical protein
LHTVVDEGGALGHRSPAHAVINDATITVIDIDRGLVYTTKTTESAFT